MNKTKLMVLTLVALTISACKKDDPPPVTQVATTATVRLGFEFMNGSASFNLTDQFTDSAGTQMKFDKVRFYASNVELIDMGGTEIAHYHDLYFLADASSGTNEWTLGTVSPTHIHDLRFNIGLDSTANHQDPMTAEAPLNDATMHWGWNPAAGYKFIVIEGRVDSDSDGVVDMNDTPFTYHIATDALLSEKEVMTHLDVVAGETRTFMLHVDVAAIAAEIDFSNNLDTHTGNNLPLAIRVRDLLGSSMELH